MSTSDTTSPVTHLRQVSQPVVDLERAIGFYRDVLGLRLIARFGPIAFVDLGGVRILLTAASETGPQPGAASPLYVAVADIDAARATLEASGVEFLDEPHEIFRDTEGLFGVAAEGEWMTFFRDSEGNLLALSCRRTTSD